MSALRYRSLHRFVAIMILPSEIDNDATNFAQRLKRGACAVAHFARSGIIFGFDAGKVSANPVPIQCQ